MFVWFGDIINEKIKLLFDILEYLELIYGDCLWVRGLIIDMVVFVFELKCDFLLMILGDVL